METPDQTREKEAYRLGFQQGYEAAKREPTYDGGDGKLRFSWEESNAPVVENNEDLPVEYKLSQEACESIQAAGAEQWSEDSPASFRPQAPSLNSLSNLTRDLRNELAIQQQQLDVEKKDRQENVTALWKHIGNEEDDTDDRFGDVHERIRRTIQDINDIHAGDVHALNEALALVARERIERDEQLQKALDKLKSDTEHRILQMWKHIGQIEFNQGR